MTKDQKRDSDKGRGSQMGKFTATPRFFLSDYGVQLGAFFLLE